MPYKLLEDVEEASPTGSESTLGYLGRNAARTAARAGETLFGLAGNTIETARPIANQVAKYAAGAGAPIIEAGLEKLTGNKEAPHLSLPTSEDIRENVTKKLTGQSLEPQGAGEKFWDDIVQDTVSLALPLPGIKGAKLGRALFQSTVGNVSGKAVQAFTGSDLLGTGAKLGTSLLAGTAGGRKAMRNLQKQSYETAAKSLTPEDVVKSQPIKKYFSELKNKVSERSFKNKDRVINELDLAISKLKTKDVPVQKLIDSQKDINKLRFQDSLGTDANRWLGDATSKLNSTFGNYGKVNPEWYKNWQVGEELTHGLNSTNYLQKVLSKIPDLGSYAENGKIKDLLFGVLGSGAVSQAIKHPTTAASIIGPILGAKEGAKAVQLMLRSPTALQHYKKLLEASAKDNLKLAVKEIANLSKAADEYDKKHPEEAESDQPTRYKELDF